MSASTHCQSTHEVNYAGHHPRVVEGILGLAMWSWDPGTRWYYQQVQAVAALGDGAAYYACISALEVAMDKLGMPSWMGFIELDQGTKRDDAEQVRRIVRRAIVVARSDAQHMR